MDTFYCEVAKEEDTWMKSPEEKKLIKELERLREEKNT